MRKGTLAGIVLASAIGFTGCHTPTEFENCDPLELQPQDKYLRLNDPVLFTAKGGDHQNYRFWQEPVVGDLEKTSNNSIRFILRQHMREGYAAVIRVQSCENPSVTTTSHIYDMNPE